MKKLLSNLLRSSYEFLWVPIFGRILNSVSVFIEGQPPKDKPTYNLRTNDKESSNKI